MIRFAALKLLSTVPAATAAAMVGNAWAAAFAGFAAGIAFAEVCVYARRERHG